MKTLVVAPHPDDEVLGVGGTLLRRRAEGAKIAWLVVTAMSQQSGWSEAQIGQRAEQIERIKQFFGFDDVFMLDFPAAQLDRVPLSDLVAAIAGAFQAFAPNEIFLPHCADIHSDHRIVFDAVASCTKWFRYPSIARVLAYETLSETDFALGPAQPFQPNVFVNIEAFLEKKLQAMEIYATEMGEFPFPRSREAIRALAALRGAASGCNAAEAFELLRERI